MVRAVSLPFTSRSCHQAWGSLMGIWGYHSQTFVQAVPSTCSHTRLPPAALLSRAEAQGVPLHL